MTDRELLELAAKAAGIELGRWDGTSFMRKDSMYSWDPLTDDCDAFRLACRLSADVFINQVTIRVEIGRIVVTQEISRGDKPAATRRAITRAAAEIGKQK